MTKRIVVRGLTGLRKIIGAMEVPVDAEYQKTIETADYATVEFVEARPKYVVYKELA